MIPHYLDYHPIITWMKDGAYQTWCWQNGKVQKYYLEIWAFKFSTPTFLVEWGIFNLAIEGPLYSEKKKQIKDQKAILLKLCMCYWHLGDFRPPNKSLAHRTANILVSGEHGPEGTEQWEHWGPQMKWNGDSPATHGHLCSSRREHARTGPFRLF